MEKNKFTLYGALGLTAMLITYLLYVPVRSLTLPLGIAVGFLMYKAGQLWVAAFKEARKDGRIKPGVLLLLQLKIGKHRTAEKIGYKLGLMLQFPHE